MSGDGESDMEYSDCDEYDYYNNGDVDCDVEQLDPSKKDPEYFSYECLSTVQVDLFLNTYVESLCTELQIKPVEARILLQKHGWNIQDIVKKNLDNRNQLVVVSKLKPHSTAAILSRCMNCPVCVTPQISERFFALSCGHLFCKDCWIMHFEIQITQKTGEK